MATFTLTGTFVHQNGTTPIVGSPIMVVADPFPLGGALQTSSTTIKTDANGHISLARTTGVVGLYYVIRSMAKVPLFRPIRFLAPTAGSTIDITSLIFYNPDPAPVEAEILAARDAALAAASAVQQGMWAATTAYTSGQTVNAPDGSQIKANSTRTSRASFDATEQTFWTPVAIKSGTLEQVANAAAYISATGRAKDVVSLGLYFPEAHGAVGDGVADDTTAVNAAFAAASNAAGKATAWLAATYRTTAPLFYFGEVDVLGGGKLVNDIAVAGGTDFWINAGISAKAVNATPWTGRWEVDFTNTANVLRTGRHHQIHRCSDVTISCVADVRPALDVPASAFGSGNDNSWCTSPSRERIRFRKTTVLASQTNANLGGEGISISQCSGGWIEDCWVQGVGDDSLAVHGVTDFAITHNVAKGPDTRIGVFDSSNGRVWGNHQQRTTNPNGSVASGGALMYIGFEGTATNTPVCADIDVRGNYFSHVSGYSSITYGVRIVGGRRISIENNRIQVFANGKAISWEGQDLTAQSWVDPEGLEVDSKARLRGISIRGNIVSGTGATSGVIDEDVAFAGHMIAASSTVADNIPGVGGLVLQTANAYVDLPVFVRQVHVGNGSAYATLTSTTEVPLQFTAVPLEDVPGGAWDLANHRWNVPVAGLYEVVATTRMTDAATSRNVQLGVRLGSEASGMPPGAFVWRNQGATRDTMTVTRMVTVAAGDTIQGRIFSDGATYPLMEASLFIRRIG